jgi:hypothetical protein
MNRKTSLALAALLVLAATGARAHGDVKCEAIPKAEWKPQMELQSKLLAEGWKKVRQVKVENGCYEVYGIDEKGAKAENFYNPKTFERVEPKSN